MMVAAAGESGTVNGFHTLQRGPIMSSLTRWTSLGVPLAILSVVVGWSATKIRVVRVSPVGGIETALIQPDWSRPEPLDSILHRDGRPDCGVAGLGGDSITNRRKNRLDIPEAYHAVPFATIAELAYPINHRGSRSPEPAAHEPGWSRRISRSSPSTRAWPSP